MKSGIELIAEERARQITEERWDASHDDKHIAGELSSAAACYAEGSMLFVDTHDGDSQSMGFECLWPWEAKDWKPGSRIRELQKAGALIAAEIDRINRAEELKRGTVWSGMK